MHLALYCLDKDEFFISTPPILPVLLIQFSVNRLDVGGYLLEFRAQAIVGMNETWALILQEADLRISVIGELSYVGQFVCEAFMECWEIEIMSRL